MSVLKGQIKTSDGNILYPETDLDKVIGLNEALAAIIAQTGTKLYRHSITISGNDHINRIILISTSEEEIVAIPQLARMVIISLYAMVDNIYFNSFTQISIDPEDTQVKFYDVQWSMNDTIVRDNVIEL